MQLGCVAKVTNLDASFLVEHFDGHIERIYPLARAILDKQQEPTQR
jgi:hypothetical protein